MFSFQINSSLLTIAICFLLVIGVIAQQGEAKRVPVVPVGDHHTHILSITAAELGAKPIPPAVELPEDITRLLRDKERLSKQRTVAAMKDLYTEDAVVQDVGGPFWLQGDRAVKYIAENTVINHLLPTAFRVDGTSGYVAGIEMTDADGKLIPASNFLYVIRKGTDGKWRVAVETFTMTGWPVATAITADELIAGLDAAGIERASVLSVAYWYGSAFRDPPVENEYAKVRAENDWVAEQTRKYPDRLSAYFSFNPLKDYAVEEIERCAKNPAFRGIKLHIGNGKVNVLNADHVARLRAIFAAANKNRLPIVIHLWTSDKTYGAPHSKAFLEQVLPAAPDIPIQIAHMAASGPGYHSDDAMEVFANAAAAGDARLKNVYFDVASMVIANTPPATLELVAKRLRQVGMKKVLFGSDWVPGRSSNESPQQAWASFRRLPLTDAEFKTVASNDFSSARSAAPAADAIETVKEFLLKSAAGDFNEHQPPYPAKFRNVRIGHVGDTAKMGAYRMCGEFLPAEGGDKAEWVAFVTLKTSGYEQYIGSSTTYCGDPKMVWDTIGDLSSALKDRLDAMKKKK